MKLGCNATALSICIFLKHNEAAKAPRPAFTFGGSWAVISWVTSRTALAITHCRMHAVHIPYKLIPTHESASELVGLKVDRTVEDGT